MKTYAVRYRDGIGRWTRNYVSAECIEDAWELAVIRFGVIHSAQLVKGVQSL